MPHNRQEQTVACWPAPPRTGTPRRHDRSPRTAAGIAQSRRTRSARDAATSWCRREWSGMSLESVDGRCDEVVGSTARVLRSRLDKGAPKAFGLRLSPAPFCRNQGAGGLVVRVVRKRVPSAKSPVWAVTFGAAFILPAQIQLSLRAAFVEIERRDRLAAARWDDASRRREACALRRRNAPAN